ncbi:MAG: ethanolamine ammonia-lyase subunit EutB, partial [Hydrogenophaga sp.]
TSFHDALAMRQLLGLRPAPEFEAWLRRMGVIEAGDVLRLNPTLPAAFAPAIARLGRSA